MAQKFYVVWAGRQTGIFTDWATAQRAVNQFSGARFKSFPSRVQAERAFREGGASTTPKTASNTKSRTRSGARRAMHTAHQFDVGIYCDGACEPNPGNAGSGSSFIAPANSPSYGMAFTTLWGPTTPPN
jgi:ribonuclease HI